MSDILKKSRKYQMEELLCQNFRSFLQSIFTGKIYASIPWRNTAIQIAL